MCLLIFSNFFSLLLVFRFDMLNNTNETANIHYTGEYGEVHEWYSRDNPTIVVDEGQIGVCYIDNEISQYITYKCLCRLLAQDM